IIAADSIERDASLAVVALQPGDLIADAHVLDGASVMHLHAIDPRVSTLAVGTDTGHFALDDVIGDHRDIDSVLTIQAEGPDGRDGGGAAAPLILEVLEGVFHGGKGSLLTVQHDDRVFIDVDRLSTDPDGTHVRPAVSRFDL